MNYYRLQIFFILAIIVCGNVMAKDAEMYTYAECQGSAMPYPSDLPQINYPDSLSPVMINHVGRHGARYASSVNPFRTIKDALDEARKQQTITKLGEKLSAIVDNAIVAIDGRWGQLDSLGVSEQQGIASRMYHNFEDVFDSCHVYAISSYVPRAMMSMYVFNYALDLINNRIEFSTTTGRLNSPLLRPFDLSNSYNELIHSNSLRDVYDTFYDMNCPLSAIERVLGAGYNYKSLSEKRKLAYDEYKVLNGLHTMSIQCDLTEFFTLDEINALWSCFNLQQYMEHSASALSTIPADIATDLLRDLIDTTDDFINGMSEYNVRLRFGHAETLMPLLSLMHMPGCYYVSSDYNNIAQNWRNFDIVPMAANLQMVLFRSKVSGGYYIMTLLNETPVAPIPGNPLTIIPWSMLRAHLIKFTKST